MNTQFASVIPTLSAVAISASLLAGCATTKLTPEQCQNQDWQAVGQADGTHGRSPNYFGKYLSQCAGIAGSQPNRQLWEQGRQQGLASFCTELNAYRRGREGDSWQPVCPAENSLLLENAYLKGRNKYLLEKQYERWDDWFPYYSHHPFYRYRRP